jgi:hypothetical protein
MKKRPMRLAAAKTPQHSTDGEKEARKPFPFEDIYDFHVGKMIPFPTERRVDRGKIILQLAGDEKRQFLFLNEVYREVGMNFEDINRWCRETPEFKRYIDETKLVLGNRRVRGSAIKNEKGWTPYDKGALATSFGHFNHPELEDEWKKSLGVVSDIKVKEADQGVGGPVTVNMFKAPDTDIVPKKKEKQ